ncbi:MAG: T9SS type A sorting domain-containing protein [Bacteroidales bacterium]|nr:T9SS type A sorting domain-containing protein [Bacteroidales bacterium]
MKRFYSMVVALLIGATSLFAQTNYTVTFSANVEMDKIQVKNLHSGVTKTLAKSDKVITLQKNAKQEQHGGSGTPIESVDQFEFLQQTGENTVVVNVEKAGHLKLTLYSLNGTFVARYSNNVDAGQNAFQIGASSGVYVLVASANNQTASLKIMLTQSTQPSILEVLTDKPEPLLKSIDDVITFDEGDTFEFTGYYNNQTDVKTAVITSDKTITFSFTKVTEPTVTTVEATNILLDGATVGGKVTSGNGASVTERGVCWATTADPTISNNKIVSGTGTGTFSVTLSSLSEGTTYYVRAYAKNSVGIAYGSTVTFTTVKKVAIVNGAIQKAFSVSDSKQVYFSQGNLQYQASTNTWRFAEHQYDRIGRDNQYISSTYSGWIDLFGWGTSGWNSGAVAYQPYSTDKVAKSYSPGGKYYNNLTGSCAKADWGGYNKITNGGNKAGMWRTLTKSEWNYLVSGRAQANRLMGQGKVNNVAGLILLPDGWVTPSSVKFVYNPGKYATNVYSLDEWAVMESYGAVFLPTAGRRAGTSVTYETSDGDYWSSSSHEDEGAYGLEFVSAEVNMVSFYRYFGRSVRLVQDVK